MTPKVANEWNKSQPNLSPEKYEKTESESTFDCSSKQIETEKLI